ncbi:MAG: DUF3098 domain-containing protein [Bacteroidales bacterium]|nr:DUF3098 domain-containing protein [Bacteroidales bacterium]
MEEKNLAFGRINYILIAVSVFLIILGFVLMTGSGTTEQSGFNPDIFSKTRIVFAPVISLFGFLLVIVGVVYKKKEK